MSWATNHIEKLNAGEIVKFRPRGNSMKGKIDSGQLCTLAPAKGCDFEVGDIVLCKVKGSQYLHLVKAKRGNEYQIGSNRGRINGWCSRSAIYGVVVGVEA